MRQNTFADPNGEAYSAPQRQYLDLGMGGPEEGWEYGMRKEGKG